MQSFFVIKSLPWVAFPSTFEAFYGNRASNEKSFYKCQLILFLVKHEAKRRSSKDKINKSHEHKIEKKSFSIILNNLFCRRGLTCICLII